MENPILVLMNGALRLSDHAALFAAGDTGSPVIPAFFLPKEMGAASRWWLLQSLQRLDAALQEKGSRLILRRGPRVQEILALVQETGASGVYLTRGYSAADVAFEKHLYDVVAERGIQCKRFAGRLLLEPEEVQTGAGTPYSVFTPFWNKAKGLIPLEEPLPEPVALKAPDIWPRSLLRSDLGLDPKPSAWAKPISAVWSPGEAAAQKRLYRFVSKTIDGYETGRDRPDQETTSMLSPHLVFGEISPRQIWHAGMMAVGVSPTAGSAVHGYLRQLGWRDFSNHQLFYHPNMPVQPLKAVFAQFPWSAGSGPALTAWQKGQTGFPIVDAGMRQLWQTGWMHNRIRMIVASFLVKDLLWHWRDGAAWFMDTLVDADVANNASGWQWVAGCGVDASPYFRIFNPVMQGEKFDKSGAYVRTFVPELAQLPAKYIHRPFEAPPEVLSAAGVSLGTTYPYPIVDRAEARRRALAALASIKG